MSAQIIPALPQPLARAIQATLDDLESEHSRRAYAHDIGVFLVWRRATGTPPIDAATVGAYKAHLRDQGKAPATINRYLSSVRAFLRKAGELAPAMAAQAEAAAKVRGVRQAGQRYGKRLSLQEAQALLNTPPADTLRGLRDRAMIALILLTGMRRGDVVSLRWSHLQQVEGHWAFVDLVRKRGKVQALLPCPPLVYRRLMVYAGATGLDTAGEGAVFVALRKGGHVVGHAISEQTVYDIIAHYAPAIAPHDLRRTCAHLARKHGAPLEQIQHLLGHESVETTDRYTGIEMDLDDNATMYIPLQDTR